jgi:hypothetical protein
LKRWTSAFGGLIAAILTASNAAGETYFSDSTAELSGSGARASRSCKLVLQPTQSLGAAPRLMLLTDGLSRLSFGIEGAAQYESVAVVRNNTRTPLIGSTGVTAQQFLTSDMGKAVKSQRLFFVTARRVDSGQYVSSRYERIDFDAVLRRLEANCPFDAEALMSDIFERERAERALSVSPSDLKSIRWALARKYGNASSEPQGNSLLPTERTYLKRYAVDHGLPASQYLNPEVVQKLKLEAPPPPPQAPPPPVRTTTWNSVAGSTWNVKGRAMTAIGYSGLQPTPEAAKAEAERKCREAGGRDCKGKGPWNYGCVFITVGHNRSQAGWASGETSEAAMKRCQGMGFTCKPPIGGCVE